ncbi:hypothetical protein [Paracidovorax citrulli]|uniref:hypothetical protein n=1 Tax=Paracidovorax citrulli TaxID=80869 RepID=UPI0005FBD6E7|nr:hypothetical protein [Paracidovorax citrulli]
MTEHRDMTNLAAKAAGIELEWPQDWGGADFLDPRNKANGQLWSPRHNNNDAFELMAQLQLPVMFGANYVIVGTVQMPTVNNADNPVMALREAIFLAAVDIGRSMP